MGSFKGILSRDGGSWGCLCPLKERPKRTRLDPTLRALELSPTWFNQGIGLEVYRDPQSWGSVGSLVKSY